MRRASILAAAAAALALSGCAAFPDSPAENARSYGVPASATANDIDLPRLGEDVLLVAALPAIVVTFPIWYPVLVATGWTRPFLG
jgi:hypothetical protein